MGIFSKAKASLRPSSKTSTVEGSTNSTLAQSAQPSTTDLEKSGLPLTQSYDAEQKEMEAKTEVAGSEHDLEQVVTRSGDPNNEEYEYPSGWKLGLISLALCLSVFCMALVRTQLEKEP